MVGCQTRWRPSRVGPRVISICTTTWFPSDIFVGYYFGFELNHQGFSSYNYGSLSLLLVWKKNERNVNPSERNLDKQK